MSDANDIDDPFALLGIDRGFEIDENELRQRFLEASARTHPDRFTDPVDQAEAAERAAKLNEAYRVLSDPELRANTLLALLGGPAKEEDKSLPPDLLMAVMEKREAQEQAAASGDRETLEQVAVWAQDKRDRHLARIGQLIEEATDAPETERDQMLKNTRLELNALRYFERMVAQRPDEESD